MNLIKNYKNHFKDDTFNTFEWDKTSFWTEYNSVGGVILATAAMSILGKSLEEQKAHDSVEDVVNNIQPVANQIMIDQLSRHINPYEQFLFDTPYQKRNNTIKRNIRKYDEKIKKHILDNTIEDENMSLPTQEIYIDIVKLTNKILEQRLPQPWLNGEPIDYDTIFFGEEESRTSLTNAENPIFAKGLFSEMGTKYHKDAVLTLYAAINPIVKNNFLFSGINEDGSVVFNQKQIEKQIKYNKTNPNL